MDRFLTIPSNNRNYRKINNYSLNHNDHSLILNKKKIERYNELEKKKLQKNFLKSLLNKNRNKSNNILEFDQYNSVLNNSLNQYKSKGLTEEELSEISTIRNNPRNIDFIENNNNKEQPIKLNDEKSHINKLKINIKDYEYKNPLNSLNIIKDNYSVFNEISKDVLVRQRNLFDKSIEALEGNLKKFNVKMPKIKVINLNNKISDEISMINLVNNEEQNENSSNIPTSRGELKLFSYFRYPNKNFPEGRSQFSLCIKENKIIISGGLSSNMKINQLWSLNAGKLQWSKINSSNTSNCRYGHTSTYFKNKIYFFGGIIKENERDVLAGLEIYNFEDESFTIPQDIIDPNLRRNHIACLLGEQILFHGGIDSDNKILDDCLLLNLNPLKWIKPIINNYSPMPKLYGHASCLVIPSNILFHYKFNMYKYPEEFHSDKKENIIKERGLYVFGGKSKDDGGLSNNLWVLILGQKPIYWKKIKTKGIPPCPRYLHSMDYFEKSNFLIIHGGRNDNMSITSALDDTFILDLSNFVWVKIKLYSNIPNFKVFSRYGHQSKVFSNKLIILGGVNNNNYIGSSLFIVNLDFYYNTKIKSEEQLIMEKLQFKREDLENEEKYLNMKKNHRKSIKELGIVSSIILPPIK